MQIKLMVLSDTLREFTTKSGVKRVSREVEGVEWGDPACIFSEPIRLSAEPGPGQPAVGSIIRKEVSVVLQRVRVVGSGVRWSGRLV